MIAAYGRNTERGIAKLAGCRPTKQDEDVVRVVRYLRPPEEPKSCVIIKFKPPTSRRIPGELHRVIDLVARMHGSTYAHVMSAERTRIHATARHACVCAVKEVRPVYSLKQLGDLFGGRDHTTIIHSLNVRGMWKNG